MITEFIREYDLTKLTPADYNPRYLPPEKLEKLKCSIRELGIIKPLIVNGDNGVLTAGHQRTRAIRACGISKAPVIRICGINIQDEIRFNLFHNSIETDKSKVRINVQGCAVGDYSILSADKINVIERANAVVVRSICELIVKYGEWGSVVCDEAGNVILNNEYAVAAKKTKTDLIVYVLPNEQKERMLEFLSEDYGEYNYDSLGIKSYNQLYCQMNRLGEGSKRALKSSLYETVVLNKINKDLHILDFGAGKCAYVNLLRAKGYSAFAYEPNFQNSKRNIDIRAVVKMIKDIEAHVREHGLFDVVVLDSVFNSVVNDEVENYVACVCRCFLKPDGVFYTATRNYNVVLKAKDLKISAGRTRQLEFLDKNLFSATFRDGVWTMQHFHTKETLRNLLSKYYDTVETFGEVQGSQVYAIARKPKKIDIDYCATALEFELNMEYPRGFKHNKHTGLKNLVLKLLKEQTNENHKN